MDQHNIIRRIGLEILENFLFVENCQLGRQEIHMVGRIDVTREVVDHHTLRHHEKRRLGRQLSIDPTRQISDRLRAAIG